MRSPQIHEVLCALGVTYEEVAKLLDWPIEKLQELATTPSNVKEEELRRIAELLDIDITMFFNDKYQIIGRK